MTDEPKGKARAQDAKPDAEASKDQPANAAEVAVSSGPDGAAAPTEAEGPPEDTPVGHPPPAVIPQVSPEAAERPKRKGKKGATTLLVYEGPADVFTAEDGTKFRPGVPTAIGGEHADELLTYPSHSFREATEAEAVEAKEQEQDDAG